MGLVGKVKGVKEWPHRWLELLQDESLQGLLDVVYQCNWSIILGATRLWLFWYRNKVGYSPKTEVHAEDTVKYST